MKNISPVLESMITTSEVGREMRSTVAAQQFVLTARGTDWIVNSRPTVAVLYTKLCRAMNQLFHAG